MSAAGSFEFVEGATSDLAFTAQGRSLTDVFHAAAEALCAATVERPYEVMRRITRTLSLHDPDRDLLLLRFLNDLIYLRDAEDLVLRPVRVDCRIEDGELVLDAEMAGEPLDASRHGLCSEVKAATAYALELVREDGMWRVSVTLDV